MMQNKAEYAPHSDTEFLTRLQRIDVALEESGWKVKSRAMVIEESDAKQSNFKKRIYKVYKGKIGQSLTDEFYKLIWTHYCELIKIQAKTRMIPKK